jgi:hypothetical protein
MASASRLNILAAFKRWGGAPASVAFWPLAVHPSLCERLCMNYGLRESDVAGRGVAVWQRLTRGLRRQIAARCSSLAHLTGP